MKAMETKRIGGRVIETKAEKRNGVEVGIVKGYIATWDVDRCYDVFVKGCFSDSVNEHRNKKRQIRLKDQHGRTIGGFPIETVREDDTGLYAEGEINLEVQQGRDVYSLLKQGVLCDFSIGFSPLEWEYVTNKAGDQYVTVRIIKKAYVWEGSVVDEPMNPEAKVTEVKAVVPYQSYSMGDRQAPWDSGQAEGRWRTFTGSEDGASPDYKKGFLWYDKKKPDLFGSYKMQIVDVIDGTPYIMPRAVFAAAAAIRGARGGVEIPEEDLPGVIANVERYYDRMGLTSPWNVEKGFRLDDLSCLDERALEAVMKTGVYFSNENAKKMVAIIKAAQGSREGNPGGDRDGHYGAEELKSIADAFENVLKTIKTN